MLEKDWLILLLAVLGWVAVMGARTASTMGLVSDRGV